MSCHKTGLGAQCAHPEPRSRAHCACSTQVVGAAARTRHAHNAQVVRRSRACWVCTGRDTPRQPAPAAAPMSRPQNDVVTRIFPIARGPCRDIKITSRRPQGQTRSRPQNRVATPFLLPSPKPGRNTKNPGRDLLETTLCRDINFMSRPRFCPQWDFQVATSPTATDVVTSKMMSRPQAVHPKSQHGFSCRDQGLLTPNLSQVATPKRMSRHQLLQSRSRCQNRSSAQPGRDFHLWSRPHVQPNQVATS